MINSLHIATPLLQHAPLSRALGKTVLLKMENLQPSGEFKLRGIGTMCARAAATGATLIDEAVEQAGAQQPGFDAVICAIGGGGLLCGAALAVAYQNLPALAAFERPLIVVCGGIAVDLGKLHEWQSRFGL